MPAISRRTSGKRRGAGPEHAEATRLHEDEDGHPSASRYSSFVGEIFGMECGPDRDTVVHEELVRPRSSQVVTLPLPLFIASGGDPDRD